MEAFDHFENVLFVSVRGIVPVGSGLVSRFILRGLRLCGTLQAEALQGEAEGDTSGSAL